MNITLNVRFHWQKGKNSYTMDKKWSLGESDNKSGVVPRRRCKTMDRPMRPSYRGQEDDETEQSLQRI